MSMLKPEVHQVSIILDNNELWVRRHDDGLIFLKRRKVSTTFGYGYSYVNEGQSITKGENDAFSLFQFNLVELLND